MTLTYTKQLYANNAITSLESAVASDSTTLYVVNGSAFPTPGSNEYFLATIGTGSDIEIVEVHGRSGNQFYGCVRGAEGTTAASHAAGTSVENRVTASTMGSLSRFQDKLTRTELLTDLGKPETINGDSYVVYEGDDVGNPVVAVRADGRWRFAGYPSMLIEQIVSADATTTYTAYTGATNLSARGNYKSLIVQVITGLNRGQARFVSNATATSISWTDPMPYAFTTGDRFEVYQSTSSYINYLLGLINLLSGNPGDQLEAILTEIRKVGFKATARVATTGPITLSGLSAIDGVTPIEGDRVLVKNQATASENGIYLASVGSWSRAIDADSSLEVTPSMVVPVSEGIANADTYWKLTTNSPIVVGTTALSFAIIVDLSPYAKLASPDLTGVPTAPTAAVNTSTTQIATTAFVNAEIENDAAPISHVGSAGSAHDIATTSVAGFMSASDKAKLDGISAGAQVNTVTSVAGRTGAITLGVADVTGAAPIASPNLSGTPTAPTAADGTSTTQLATTAFVTNAVSAVGAFVSTGMVAYFARSTAPNGWLKANGAAVNRVTYASLYSAIGTTFGSGDGSTTFNLPDLRGEFVRGLDDSRGVDTGRTLGSAQASSFASHQHKSGWAQTDSSGYTSDSILRAGTIAENGGIAAGFRDVENGNVDNTSTTDIVMYTTATGGTETRPRNIALLACIKY